MKRAIMIGIGCLLIAGCRPEGASDVEDEAAPLLSASAADAPAEPTMDIGGVEESIKPCPACNGQWNAPAGILDYLIPEGTDVSSPEMTLVVRYADGDPQKCLFEGLSGGGEVAVDCKPQGSPISAELVFLSGSGRMSVPILITAAAPPIL